MRVFLTYSQKKFISVFVFVIENKTVVNSEQCVFILRGADSLDCGNS